MKATKRQLKSDKKATKKRQKVGGSSLTTRKPDIPGILYITETKFKILLYIVSEGNKYNDLKKEAQGKGLIDFLLSEEEINLITMQDESNEFNLDLYISMLENEKVIDWLLNNEKLRISNYVEELKLKVNKLEIPDDEI